MKATIYYDAFSGLSNRPGEDMTEIATFSLEGLDHFDFKDGDLNSLIPVLEQIFHDLNTIDGPWYSLAEDSRVTLSDFTRQQGGARSMSAGDYVKIGERGFKVAGFGFTEVPATEIDDRLNMTSPKPSLTP